MPARSRAKLRNLRHKVFIAGVTEEGWWGEEEAIQRDNTLATAKLKHHKISSLSP